MPNSPLIFNREEPYPPLLVSLPERKEQAFFYAIPKPLKVVMGLVALTYSASFFLPAEKTQAQLLREMNEAAEKHAIIKMVIAEAARENTYYNVPAELLTEAEQEQRIFTEASSVLVSESKNTLNIGNFKH